MKIPEVLLLEVDHAPGSLAEVLRVVGDAGLTVEGLQAITRSQQKTIWELTLEIDHKQSSDVFERIAALNNAKILGRSDRVFSRHVGGKISMQSQVALDSLQTLRDVYTPGVARVCLAIQEDPAKARDYTALSRTVAIVTNGSAILGLGNIGAVAGLPVMEGKAALFASLSGLSGVPILIEDLDAQRIVDTVERIAPSFGAIQLEDIRAPECFEIEDELRRRLDIPVLHDDQHGTAVVALGALLSAARQVGKELRTCTVGQIGLGAAGIGIVRLLRAYGVEHVLGSDLNEDALRRLEALGGQACELPALMGKADIVIATTGVPGLIKPSMVRQGQLILALSNPDPEIEAGDALAASACFAADGKSVNNVLGFPGLFRGALRAGAKSFTDAMLIAAAETISELAPDGQLVPDPLIRRVHERVSLAVEKSARSSHEKERGGPKPPRCVHG